MYTHPSGSLDSDPDMPALEEKWHIKSESNDDTNNSAISHKNSNTNRVQVNNPTHSIQIPRPPRRGVNEAAAAAVVASSSIPPLNPVPISVATTADRPSDDEVKVNGVAPAPAPDPGDASGPDSSDSDDDKQANNARRRRGISKVDASALEWNTIDCIHLALEGTMAVVYKFFVALAETQKCSVETLLNIDSFIMQTSVAYDSKYGDRLLLYNTKRLTYQIEQAYIIIQNNPGLEQSVYRGKTLIELLKDSTSLNLFVKLIHLLVHDSNYIDKPVVRLSAETSTISRSYRQKGTTVSAIKIHEYRKKDLLLEIAQARSYETSKYLAADVGYTITKGSRDDSTWFAAYKEYVIGNPNAHPAVLGVVDRNFWLSPKKQLRCAFREFVSEHCHLDITKYHRIMRKSKPIYVTKQKLLDYKKCVNMFECLLFMYGMMSQLTHFKAQLKNVVLFFEPDIMGLRMNLQKDCFALLYAIYIIAAPLRTIVDAITSHIKIVDGDPKQLKLQKENLKEDMIFTLCVNRHTCIWLVQAFTAKMFLSDTTALPKKVQIYRKSTMYTSAIYAILEVLKYRAS